MAGVEPLDKQLLTLHEDVKDEVVLPHPVDGLADIVAAVGPGHGAEAEVAVAPGEGGHLADAGALP